MKEKKYVGIGLKVAAAGVLVLAFILSFTLSDYYIFNRIGQFGFFFCISQWVKKAGLLLIPLAVFFRKKCCADIVKYVLPPFVILSFALFGNFFDITVVAKTPQQEIYNSINLFMPKWLNMSAFFAQNVLILGVCALLFVRDGYKVDLQGFKYFPCAMLICMPLNIFENFFDINTIAADSFLRFYNFTVWHFIAIVILAAFTIGAYYFLKDKKGGRQDEYLAALAIALLIQYHSKDSMVLGDGYNVYNTVFACLPLFICNIGVYVASLSVILKKKVLYQISFFVHAVGALTVFIYFGKDSMSNYGIFCSFSILYFCLTHCFLFALCVLPSALGKYRFQIKDCVIPIIYYCVVIIIAAVSSALVTEFLTTFSVNGYTLSVGTGEEFDTAFPNYAFTQVNPLPFDVPVLIPLGGAFRHINVFYVVLVYIAYICLFFAFTGLYYAFLALRKKWLEHRTYAPLPEAQAEAAASEDQEE